MVFNTTNFERLLYVDKSMQSEASISFIRILLACLCPILVGCVFAWYKMGLSKALVVGTVRASMQLFLLGYVLLGFIFSMNSPCIMCAYILFMILVASFEVTLRQSNSYNGHWNDSLLALLSGCGVVIIFAAGVVFSATPWWNPRVVIPAAGMIVGSALNGPTIGVERLLNDVLHKKSEIETRLAFGACDYEAIMCLLRPALLAALLPQMNLLAIIGLVSIPGMMTGQLLAGASPAVAAQYQMAITWLNVTANLLTTFTTMSLAMKHAVFDRHHRVTTSNIFKRKSAAPMLLISQCVGGVLTAVNKLFCCLAYCPSLNNPPAADSSDCHNRSKPAMWRLEENPESPSLQYLELDEPLDHRQPELLSIRALNVLCGDAPLFGESDGLSLGLRRGERVTLEGPSGLGKTRLLRAIAQLDRFYGGDLTLSGNLFSDDDSKATYFSWITCSWISLERPQWRSQVLYVPQAVSVLQGSPKSFLLESCEYRSRNKAGGTKKLVSELDRECSRMERELLLSEGKLSQAWALLSGGERQRAVIACALLLAGAMQKADPPNCPNNSTDNALLPLTREVGDLGDEDEEGAVSADSTRPFAVLLLDEPTAACDAVACAAVERALIASGVACIVVTHDEQQARRIAHKRVTLFYQ